MLKVMLNDFGIIQEEKLASYIIEKNNKNKKITLQFGERIDPNYYLTFLELLSFDSLQIILINDETKEESIVYSSKNAISLESLKYNILENNNILVELTYIEL